MKPSIHTIIADVRSGQNLDVYIPIAIALVAAILGLLNITPLPALNTLILATLALVAYSLLTIRMSIHDSTESARDLGINIEHLADRLSKSEPNGPVMIGMDYPEAELKSAFYGAKSVCILGATLAHGSGKLRSICEHVLNNNGLVRIILSEPSAKTLEQLSYFSALRSHKAETIESDIRKSIDLLSVSYDSEASKGRFEIRTIPAAPSFCMTIIENSIVESKAYVKLVSFRAPGSSPTILVDGKKDSNYYKFFAEQFEALWVVATRAQNQID